MKIRTMMLVTVTATGVLVLPAQAAPRPRQVCNLIADGQNDTQLFSGTLTVKVPSKSLDITTADLVIGKARNGKMMATAVMRVSDLDSVDDPFVAATREYYFTWKGQGGRENYVFKASIAPNNQYTYHFGRASVIDPGSPSSAAPRPYPPASANGKVDLDRNEIRIWAPVNDLLALRNGVGALKPGAKQSNFLLLTMVHLPLEIGQSYVTDQVQSAARLAYVSGHPSCAKNGE